MKSLRDWQREIRKVCLEKGFDWEKEDLDSMLIRIVSELGEIVESERDGNMEHVGEELADVFIRLADCCDVLGIDLETEVEKKMEINRNRPFRHSRKFK